MLNLQPIVGHEGIKEDGNIIVKRDMPVQPASQPCGYHRRKVVLGISILPALVACSEARGHQKIRILEAEIDGTIGFVCKNLATGRVVTYRGDTRFAMCSTFKWALAAVILRQVEQGHVSLGQRVSYTQSDMVTYAPVTSKNLQKGSMTVAALCRAAVSFSDNTAANLLLRLINGPLGFTKTLREFGDKVTRLDRWETELNENLPNDPRDTTTAQAMIDLLEILLFQHPPSGQQVLSEASQLQLRQWMIESKTGLARLRAGIPTTWQVGDKTGTSGNGAFNNVAFALPPNNVGPILMAAYINAPNASMARANATHAALAKIALSELGRI